MSEQAANVNLTLYRTSMPTLDMMRQAQPIGYTAWSKRLAGKRTDAEIRHVFDPRESHDNSQRLLKRMQGKVGRFAGVLAVMDGEPVGFALASDDVGNMSRIAQRAKTLGGKLLGEQPYVWTAHINVLPDFQRLGIGSAMLREVHAPFGADQRRTAYVLDENQLALDWFRTRSYEPKPSESVDPNLTPDGPDIYFGPDAQHSLQWRLEALPVGDGDKAGAAFASRGLPNYQVVEGAYRSS